MSLHRVIDIAAFVGAGGSDPLWSRTQPGTHDPFSPLPVGTVFVEPIVASGQLRKIQWWGVGYNGAGESAAPVDSTGFTWDAAFVTVGNGTGRTPEYSRYTSIAESLGAAIEAGRRSVEFDLPPGVQGWLSIISFTPALAATHFHIKYDIQRSNG